MDSQRYLFYLIVFSIFFFSMDIYFVIHWTKFIKRKGKNKWLFKSVWIIAGITALITLYTFWIRYTNKMPTSLEKVFYIIPVFWYFPKALISPVLIVADLIKLIDKLFRKHGQVETISKRREFIRNTAWVTAGIPFMVVADGFLRTTNQLKINTVTVRLHEMPAVLDELKIVQISDIHAGSFSTPKLMQDVVWSVRILNPDLIFITGDYVNFHCSELSLIVQQLKSLEAKYGVYGCLGNHDHYMPIPEQQILQDIIRDCNIRLLINENITLDINGEKLQIAGVDNTSYRQNFGNFGKALGTLDPNHKTILLCHDPTNWDKSVRGKWPVDLMLSGHTHGGQIGIELFGEKLTPARLEYKEFAGLYQAGDQYLYVNSGIGTIGPPIRIGVPPELTLIILKKEEQFAQLKTQNFKL